MISEDSMSRSPCSIALGPKVRQNIIAGSMWKSKAAHLMKARKHREKKRGRKGSMDKIYPVKPHLQ
jgi:hypothetical protein